jgi:hypothetical protein
MRPSSIKVTLVLFLLLVLGCGGVSVTRVTDATYTEGVRYWDSQPYLTSAGTVIWLPDPTRGYVIKPRWSLVSTTTLNVQVTNGWQLSSLGAVQTPQVLPVLGQVAQTVAGKLTLKAEETPIKLWPLRWDAETKAWRIEQ